MPPIRPYVKQVFVLTIRDAIHFRGNLASGTLEDVQTGQESGSRSGIDLLSLPEATTGPKTTAGDPNFVKHAIDGWCADLRACENRCGLAGSFERRAHEKREVK